MPDNVLVIANGLTYSGAMLLALANRVQLPAAAAPAIGNGTYQNPYVLQGLSQWMAPAPALVKRFFINVGGRMMLKRANRGPDGWDGYVTDLGPLAEAQARLPALELAKANFPSTLRGPALPLGSPARGPDHRDNTARQSDPRWYMQGVQNNDAMFDPNLSHVLGADYTQITNSLNAYMDSTGWGDSSIAKKMRLVLADSSSVTDLPPSAALLCTAWFSAESGRHPRSLLSSLILLKLIAECTHIQLPTAQANVTVSTQVRFSTVIEHSSSMPHPMTGKGTVAKATASQNRAPQFQKTIADSRDITNTLEKLNVQNLNVVEAREAEIFMEWLSRTLVKFGGQGAQKVSRAFALQQGTTSISDPQHPSLHPQQRPGGSALCDQNIIAALGSVL